MHGFEAFEKCIFCIRIDFAVVYTIIINPNHILLFEMNLHPCSNNKVNNSNLSGRQFRTCTKYNFP